MRRMETAERLFTQSATKTAVDAEGRRNSTLATDMLSSYFY
jgi:hypothetical protein